MPGGEKRAVFIELRSSEDRTSAACRHIEHLYREGRTVAVYAPDPKDAEDLDLRLWTFRQGSFIPHVRLERCDGPPIEPVVIFSGEPAGLAMEVLFLFGARDLPAWFAQFPCIYDFAEVYDEQLRQASRRRFAECRNAGYEMKFIASRPGQP